MGHSIAYELEDAVDGAEEADAAGNDDVDVDAEDVVGKCQLEVLEILCSVSVLGVACGEV